MGRARVEPCPGNGCRPWRTVVVALAALALLATGLSQALPRSAAPAAPVAATAAAGNRPSMEAPAADLVVRGAPLAVVPAPTGPAAGLLPVGGPLVAPHLVAQPHTRPPTAGLAATSPGAPGSRAPPATTGT